MNRFLLGCAVVARSAFVKVSAGAKDNGWLEGILIAGAIGVAPDMSSAQVAKDMALHSARTEQGLVVGVPSPVPGVTVFRGIPYAAPPMGESRWRPPATPAMWASRRRADAFAASCMQPELHQIGAWTQEFFATPPYSEDCLYLNVWTKSSLQGKRRPVMVWFHGGALVQGGANLPMYYGDALAAKGIVLVSVNYRLGAFGFLAHPELTRESPHHASGNYGFMDQRAALQWVQHNVAAFGGDPQNVTIFGQSAGARSVTMQLFSPLSRGLFHRAVAQSGVGVEGVPGPLTPLSLAAAEGRGVEYQKAAGASSLAELRAQSAGSLQKVSGFQFGAVVDGYFLPATPAEIITKGTINDVPILTGFNIDEGLRDLDVAVDPDKYVADSQTLLGSRTLEFLELYPSGTQATQSSLRAGNDREIVAAAMWAQARARHSKAPLFFYVFDHPLPGATAGKYGSFHSAELPYVFHTLPTVTEPLSAERRPLTDKDVAVADQVSSYWVNFATSGNPNGPGLPQWPVFDASKPMVMQLGDRPEPRPIVTPEKLRFWQSVVPTLPAPLH